MNPSPILFSDAIPINNRMAKSPIVFSGMDDDINPSPNPFYRNHHHRNYKINNHSQNRHRRNKFPNDGGNFYMALGYLASWLGPIYDIQDLYDGESALSPVFMFLIIIGAFLLFLCNCNLPKLLTSSSGSCISLSSNSSSIELLIEFFSS